MRFAFVVIAATSVFCINAKPIIASQGVIRTDANLVTAFDVSDSIGRHEEWVQHTGMARGLLDLAFLDAVRGGHYGRIGFAVFTWSSDGRYDLIVPWVVIGSIDEAKRVAALLSSVTLIDRSQGDEHEEKILMPNRLTDISAAIDHASNLLALAPYKTMKSVINICANGSDNVEGGPEPSRDNAVTLGITINGVVLGSNVKVVDYFRSNVIGGPGAFVMELTDPQSAGEVMAEKLRRDLIAAVQVPAAGR